MRRKEVKKYVPFIDKVVYGFQIDAQTRRERNIDIVRSLKIVEGEEARLYVYGLVLCEYILKAQK